MVKIKDKVTLSAIAPLLSDTPDRSKGELTYDEALQRYEIIDDSDDGQAAEVSRLNAQTAPPAQPRPDPSERFRQLAEASEQWKGPEVPYVAADDPRMLPINLNMGVLKGMGSTVFGLGKLFHGAALGDFGAFDDPTAKEDLGLVPHGTAQNAGFFTEQVAESFLPAGSARRGAQAIASAVQHVPDVPRMLRMAGRLGGVAATEAASGAGTALAQTGGDLDAAETGGVFGGAAAALTGIPGALQATRAASSVPEMLLLADEFKVPLTRGQQTQGTIRQLVESMVRKAAFGFRSFAKFDLKQNEALRKAGEEIVTSIDPKVMKGREFGLYVQGQLDEADKVARAEYDSLITSISDQVGTAELQVDDKLAARAQELLVQLKDPTAYAPGLRSVDDLNKAISILEDFATPTTSKVKTPAVSASTVLGPDGMPVVPGTAAVIEEVPKTLTFDQARRLRTLLYKLTDSDEITIGEGALKQLNKALHAEMENALTNTGHPDMASLFTAASQQYGTVQGLLKEGAIRGLRNKNTPEVIADVLLGPGAETDATLLRQLLHKESMHKVQAAVVERAIDRSLNDADILLGPTLKKTIDRLGSAKAVLFNDQVLLAKIHRFVRLADKVRTPGNTAQIVEGGRFAPLAAQLTARAAAGGMTVAGTQAVLGRSSEDNNFWVYTTAGVIGAIAPGIMAKMMTRPGVVDDLTKALTTPTATAEGKQLAARITALVTSEMRAEQKGEGGRNANVSLEIPAVPSTDLSVDEAIERARKIYNEAQAAANSGDLERARRLEQQYDDIMRGLPENTRVR